MTRSTSTESKWSTINISNTLTCGRRTKTSQKQAWLGNPVNEWLN